MASDDGDDVIVTQQRPRRKQESKIGNFIEAVTTYMSGLFIYAPVNAFLIFGPLAFESDASQARFWPIWILFSLIYYGANAWAAVINTQARFSSKTFRFFADMGASATPLILGPLMILLAILGVYEPTRMDFFIVTFTSIVSLIDLLAHSNIVQTAIRRVREGFVDS